MAEDFELFFEFRNKRFKDAEVGLRSFHQALKKDWDGAAKVLSRELKTFLDAVAEAMSQRHGNSYPGGTTAKTLSKRSGNTIASIFKSVAVSGTTFDTITGQIGGDYPLHVHEYGATIRKKSKMLTIPLPPALNGDGTPKKKSARDWKNTFVARSKKGNLLIFQKEKGGKITPLYVLKDEVTIPPRLGMGDTLRVGIPYFVDTSMQAMLHAILKGNASS